MNRALVIYHGNCDDGFGAAWAFHQLKEKDYDEVKYFEGHYNTSFPEIDKITAKETDVYILDFSYSLAILAYAAGFYRDVVQLDHHRSAMKDYCKARNIEESDYLACSPADNLFIHFDMNRSGALMAWDHFNGIDIQNSVRAPRLLVHIQDNDLWRFDYKETKAVIAGLRSYPKTFEAWDKLDINYLEAEGNTILRYYNQQIESAIKATKRSITINLTDILDPRITTPPETVCGLACNLPPMFASDVGNILAKESGTFGATYFTDSSGDTSFSLRSIGDYDVSVIAKSFGGGGHRNAAGFKLSSPNLSDKGITLWQVKSQEE